MTKTLAMMLPAAACAVLASAATSAQDAPLVAGFTPVGTSALTDAAAQELELAPQDVI